MKRSVVGRLALLLVLAVFLAGAMAADAAVVLTRFEATAQQNEIVVVWETATELDAVGFKLYRAESFAPANWGAAVYETRAAGAGLVGATYNYTDANALRGVRYYYRLEELVSAGTGGFFGPVNAEIDLPPELTATPTATLAPATATATATVLSGAAATSTATATNVPGSGGAATATRRFTNTPPPPAAAAPGVTAAPGAPANPTATPVGAGVVSTPTDGPQPPATAAIPAIATPLPPAALTAPAASPSLEIVATSAVQPALGLTPEATRPLPVFAAATSQPLPDTPGRPTPAPTGEEPRDTRTILLLGGGAIIIAVALGGVALLLSRSRRS